MKVRAILIPLLLIQAVTSVLQAQTRDSTARLRQNRYMFSDKQEITSSDYLASIEKANDIMNQVGNEGVFNRGTKYIFADIVATHSTISELTTNIKGAGGTNVRNQRMYEKLLLELREKLDSHRENLKQESENIIGQRKKLRGIIKDTIFRKIIRDSVLREQFSPQLKGMREKFRSTDSILKANLSTLNAYKAETSRKKIIISESLDIVNDRLDRSGATMFGNECPNLWESAHDISATNFAPYITGKFPVEIKAFSYYFGYSLRSTLMIMLFTGLIFWWIRSNLAFLRSKNKIDTLEEFNFRALNHGALVPSIIVGLNVAIALNLYAPALYIEFLHLLLLIVLTVTFSKRWTGRALSRWILLVLIFVAFSFVDLFLKVSFIQRCIFISINIVAIRYGMVYLKAIREQLYVKRFFSLANFVFISFNLLAIVFNLFGRVSIAYTLSLTAIIAITQMIALSVLLKIIIEMITLQIYTTRLKRGISRIFDHESLAKNAQKPFLVLVTYLWIVVIASNLNISETLYNIAGRVFNRENSIGSFSFTIGSVLMFLLIVWIAHLLQNFVAFFFGEIEMETEENVNKRQHSKLLITRLVLLICGYLLAISASGMPVDKITIILGALGVGVGLGLQSVVNNFVSGVILIFERPIQIGDVIESGNQSGRVKEIGLRTTKIDTANGAEVIIPNGNILSQNITNWTYSNNYKLADLSFQVNGKTNPDELIQIIQSTLNTLPEVATDLEPQILFQSVAEERLTIRLRFWCNIYRTDHALSSARILLRETFSKRGLTME